VIELSIRASFLGRHAVREGKTAAEQDCRGDEQKCFLHIHPFCLDLFLDLNCCQQRSSSVKPKLTCRRTTPHGAQGGHS
jgi:hypothetical protein